MKRTRRNLFGFGRHQPATRPGLRSSLTIAQAARQAAAAGRRLGSEHYFEGWLRQRRLDDRSAAQIDRLRQRFDEGVAARRTAVPGKAGAIRTARHATRAVSYQGYAIRQTGDGWTVPRIDRDSVFDTPKEAKAFIKTWKAGRENPRTKKRKPTGAKKRKPTGRQLRGQLENLALYAAGGPAVPVAKTLLGNPRRRKAARQLRALPGKTRTTRNSFIDRERPGYATGNLLKSIHAGDRVTIRMYRGGQKTGRAVMRGPAGWVLNMGGRHGTPDIADERNIVKVRHARERRNPGGADKIGRAERYGRDAFARGARQPKDDPRILNLIESARGIKTDQTRYVTAWLRGWHQANLAKRGRRNPGRAGDAFARCVAEVTARGGAYSPRGVCATAARRKYGQAELTRMAQAGKRRAARSNPRTSRNLPVLPASEIRAGMTTVEPDGFAWRVTGVAFRNGKYEITVVPVHPSMTARGEPRTVKVRGTTRIRLARNPGRGSRRNPGGYETVQQILFRRYGVHPMKAPTDTIIWAADAAAKEIGYPAARRELSALNRERNRQGRSIAVAPYGTALFGPAKGRRNPTVRIGSRKVKVTRAGARVIRRLVAHDRLRGGRTNGRRASNPAEESEQMYRMFHGRDADQTVEYISEEHEHSTLWGLGDLSQITVETAARGRYIIDVAKVPRGDKYPDPSLLPMARRVVLAASEDGRQLYLVSGDQSLDTKALGLADADVKDNTLIGVVTNVVYQTAKSFHKFELTNYTHKLGEETGHQPVLVYHPRTPSMEIVGGRYRIERAGIID